MIQFGELPPGTRLREAQLCEQLGVSRTPLREALRTLAAEGLVNQLPNRSMVVAALDPDDVEHLYRVFGDLEGLAGELACARVTEHEIAEMGRLLSRMVDLHERGDRAEYMGVNQQIHRMVIDIAANPVLLSVWQSLLPRVERARTLPNLDRARWTARCSSIRRCLRRLPPATGRCSAGCRASISSTASPPFAASRPRQPPEGSGRSASAFPRPKPRAASPQ